ncbi:hypothetical protein [Bacillus licheniformis]|uniref:hypothetical protein n=1 Tax=Bacillus licheniformis TaxID=1402 RepID=UPI0021B37147|nr:hypothetical protein [Bacillus licheniformis]
MDHPQHVVPLHQIPSKFPNSRLNLSTLTTSFQSISNIQSSPTSTPLSSLPRQLSSYSLFS